MVQAQQRMRKPQGRREIDADFAFGAHPLGVGHLRQPLDPRLRLLGLGGAGAEAVDEALQMGAFGLSLLVGDLLQAQMLGTLALEGGVVAGVQLGLAAVQVQGMGVDVVQELSVVRDQQQRARVLQQPLLQPQHRIEVEVVGGLVEQQHVGRRHQRARQVQAHAPAARERGHRALLDLGREPQAVQQLPRARGAVVAAHFLQPVVRLGHRLPVLVGEGVGFGLQGLVHDGVAGQHEVDGRVRQRGHFLGDAGDAQARGQVQVATVGFHLAAHGGEQGRFAGAVAADHAHPPTGVQGHVDIGQQQAFAPAEGEIAKGNHGRRRLWGAADTSRGGDFTLCAGVTGFSRRRNPISIMQMVRLTLSRTRVKP